MKNKILISEQQPKRRGPAPRPVAVIGIEPNEYQAAQIRFGLREPVNVGDTFPGSRLLSDRLGFGGDLVCTALCNELRALRQIATAAEKSSARLCPVVKVRGVRVCYADDVDFVLRDERNGALGGSRTAQN